MKWDLEHGKNYEWFQKLEEDGHIKRAKVLDERPELLGHLHEIWDAFEYLNRSRISGFGVGPILLTEMESYFRMSKTPPESYMQYVRYVQSMDSVMIDYVSEKAKTNGPST